MPALQIVSLVVFAAGAVVAVVLLTRGARGRSRVAAVIGTLLVMVATLSDMSYRYLLGPILGDVSDATLIKTLSGEIVLQAVLTAIGLSLLTYAVVVAGRLKVN